MYIFFWWFRSWLIVEFSECNSIQHVPYNWYKPYTQEDPTIEAPGKCWFPHSKADLKLPQKGFSFFKNQQIDKMIKEAFEPNTIDAIWHDSIKIAEPFGKGNKLIICIVFM